MSARDERRWPSELPADPAAQAEYIDMFGPRVGGVLKQIMRMASGDFGTRAEVSDARDELDAIVVGLNMLAESFQRERLLRDRAEALLADAIDSYENAPGLFCSVDVDGLRIVKCNQTLSDAVGCSKTALHGRSILELCATASRELLERALRAMLASTGSDDATAADALRAIEVELLRAQGGVLTATVSGSVMRDEQGNPLRLRLSLRDVTNERKLESQLLHAQKMEALGQLAGGVAHDFNNLLMVIQSATALLARKIGLDSPNLALVGQVQDAAGRAGSLTRQLLTFARREVTRPTQVDVGALVRRNAPMLSRLVGPSITLCIQVGDGRNEVLIDATRLDQALMNLIINARDAMPSGGTITVAVDEGLLQPTPERGAARCVRLSVIDSGHGIAPADKLRIFEPFFTTKAAGSGTGLGLAMVYGIVSQAGGQTHVSSELGRGSRFDLCLPRAGSTPPSAPQPSIEGQAPTGHERILVVDDEPVVRALTAHVLRDAGYVVLEANSAAQALTLGADVLDGLALVLSDVIMPGMPGTELVDALCAARPKLRAVLMSGYAADHRIRDHWFLAKPFDPGELLRMVRKRLDA